MNPRTTRILIVLAAVSVALLLVLVAIMLAGDGGGEAATTSSIDAPTTTTAGGVTTTTGDTSVTTQPATTTTASPATSITGTTGACSAMPGATTPALDAPGVTSVLGDFDGVGGASDLLIAYHDGDGDSFVQVALDYGYAAELPVEGPARAYGTRDFGGVAEHVGFAAVSAGASTEFVGFFHLDGCELRLAGFDGGGDAVFGVGGSVTHLDGIRCTADGLEIRSATSADGVSWEYTSATLHWVPGLGEFQTVASSIVVLTSPADDDTIFAAGAFDCFPGG
ncbi:MAG: hypothetical protein WD652_00520 [Acidimicrobiia bacterium]